MMRLARTASLLVAFSLLTSAATAYAECAWVLWYESTESKGQRIETRPWNPIEALGSKAECSKMLAEKIAATIKSISPPYAQGFTYLVLSSGDEIVVRHEQNWGFTSAYRCLPDTVNPRGPKGK